MPSDSSAPSVSPTLTLTQPDDWHLHLREGEALKAVIGASAKQMARAIIMPNLKNPVTTTKKARAYRDEIRRALPTNSAFTPLMTLYLTDNTTTAEITTAAQSDFIHGVKLYPSGATTNSDSGVTDIKNTYAALEAMQKSGLPLLIHGEVTDADVDVFDREKIFIDTVLMQICRDFPALKIVLEHITTKEAVDFINASPDNIAATITAHHLLANRNDMFAGGIKPHYFCLPLLKRKNPHQHALINAATSDSGKFFLGTDSAPHATKDKESACGCAGIFSAHAAIELYAHAFERVGKLDKLEAFASFYGADFYNLPRNTRTITLIKQDWNVPETYPLGSESLVAFWAGKTLNWTLHI